MGAPLLIGVIYFGGTQTFFWLTAVAAALCALEMKQMFNLAGKPLSPHLVIPFTLFLLLPFYLERYDLAVFLLFALFLCLIFYKIFFGGGPSDSIPMAANTLFTVIYISFCLGFLILVRKLDETGYFVFFILAATWMGDTMAFYTGTHLGKRPIAPLVSPKKTVEGAMGGLAGSLIAGILFHFTLLPSLTLFHCAMVALVCGVFGQLGDLLESMVKRELGAKDSGTILPGHGGLLDRIDGILLSAPAFYVYYRMVLL